LGSMGSKEDEEINSYTIRTKVLFSPKSAEVF